jgi:hypothetical protein
MYRYVIVVNVLVFQESPNKCLHTIEIIWFSVKNILSISGLKNLELKLYRHTDFWEILTADQQILLCFLNVRYFQHLTPKRKLFIVIVDINSRTYMYIKVIRNLSNSNKIWLVYAIYLQKFQTMRLQIL